VLDLRRDLSRLYELQEENLMKLIKKLFLLSGLTICLTACHHKNNDHTISVGTITGPETDLMVIAKQVALKKFGLDVKIITFNDYLQPNRALAEGDIDANMFQHKPYLDSEVAEHHYPLVIVGKTFVYPVGIYSIKIKNLKALPNNAIVAIPNDPTNEGRALLLLKKAHLIVLRRGIGISATPQDIVHNPRHLQFKELDAANLTRALPDVTLAVINTNYAMLGGFTPSKDALFLEGTDSPYVNVIVARKDDADSLRVKELVEAFQSPEVKQAAQQIFKGQAIAAWK
jgi:D-methionine transport system substrate-binding protein